MITLILILLMQLHDLVMMRRLESAASLSEEDRSSARDGMGRQVVCLITLVMLQVTLWVQ